MEKEATQRTIQMSDVAAPTKPPVPLKASQIDTTWSRDKPSLANLIYPTPRTENNLQVTVLNHYIMGCFFVHSTR